MTCANCIELRERLRVAERELGLRRRDGAIGAIMHRLGLEPMQAALVLDLYEGGGRCVSTDRLIANMGTTGRQALTVQVFKIRGKLGEGFIETYTNLGYGLPVVSMSRVLAAVTPPTLQDERGGA